MRVFRSRLVTALVAVCIVLAVGVGGLVASTRRSSAHPGSTQTAMAATAAIDVHSNATTIFPGSGFVWLSASCLAGEQLVGGGYQSGLVPNVNGGYDAALLLASYPAADLRTWTVEAGNFSTGGDNVPEPLSVYAECLPTAYDPTMQMSIWPSDSTPLSGATPLITASCPAGATATGGGFATSVAPDNDPENVVYLSAPNGTSAWGVGVDAVNSPEGDMIQAFALCATGPGIHAQIESDSSFGVAPGASGSHTLACSHGGFLTEGGLVSGGFSPQDLSASYPSDATASAWDVTDVNVGSLSELMPEAVMCVQLGTIAIAPLSPAPIEEGATFTATDTFTDSTPNATAWTGTVNYGDGQPTEPLAITTTGGLGFSLNHEYADERASYPVTVTINDNMLTQGRLSFTIEVDEAPITDLAITAPTAVAVGSIFQASATFTDPSADTFGAQWDQGDGFPAVNSSVTPGSQPNTRVVGPDPLVYNQPGIYTLTLTVTEDDDGSTITRSVQVAAYNPKSSLKGSGGYTSTYFWYFPNPQLTGPVTFTLSCKYSNVGTTPTCSNSLNFKAAPVRFQSVTTDYLVITGAKARMAGTGTVNGVAGYRYDLSVIDGSIAGKGASLFRIRIWNAATGAILYDTQPADPLSADPTTPLSAGSTITLKG